MTLWSDSSCHAQRPVQIAVSAWHSQGYSQPWQTMYLQRHMVGTQCAPPADTIRRTMFIRRLLGFRSGRCRCGNGYALDISTGANW